MTREEMLQDLNYARTLAEEGRQAPLIGGAYLVMFGLMLGACYAGQYAALTGAMPLQYLGPMWLMFGVAAFVGVMLLRGRTRAMPGGASIANRADRVVWQGVTAAILAVVIGSILRTVLTADTTAPNVIMAAGFGLYGVVLYSTSCLSNAKWLRGFAFVAFLVSAGLWFFMDEPWAYVLASAASIVVLLIPGLVMMRREPTSVA